MGIKLLHKVAILVTIIYICQAQENTPDTRTEDSIQTTLPSTTDTPPPYAEELLFLDDDLQERKLTLKANTKYNVSIKGECLNYKLSVAVLEADCSNKIRISFNERQNIHWTCQKKIYETKRVYDSAIDTLTINVPDLKNDRIALLISAYFVSTDHNEECIAGKDSNYFVCKNCRSADDDDDVDESDEQTDSYKKHRYIHKDLKCNGRKNCDRCDEDVSDENNVDCPVDCSENYWTGFHDTQYMLTILLAGLFFIMSPIVLVMVLFYNRKMSPAARERARLQASRNDVAERYARSVQPPPTYEDVHDIKEPPPTFHEVVLDSSNEVIPSRTNNNNV